MNKCLQTKLRNFTAISLVALYSLSANGLDIKAGINIGAEHSDNVLGQAEDAPSDLKTIAGASIDVSHLTEALDSTASYQITKTH